MILAAPLSPREVAAADGRTAAHKIARVIRDRIDTGKLQTADTLPPERELAAHLGCARETVREAYKILSVEGVIIRRRGHPAVVRLPPPGRLMDERRYAEELERARAGKTERGLTGFVRDYACSWSEYTVIPEFTREAATEDHAPALGVGAGDDMLFRRMVERVRGVPVQIHESRIAMAVVGEDNPAEDPERYPWPGGTVALLWSLGYTVRQVLTEAEFERAPTPREAADLLLYEGQNVATLSRRFLVGEGDADSWVPIEASTLTVPAAHYRLRWATTV